MFVRMCTHRIHAYICTLIYGETGGRQTDRQTDRQTNREAGRQTHRRRNRQIDKYSNFTHLLVFNILNV